MGGLTVMVVMPIPLIVHMPVIVPMTVRMAMVMIMMAVAVMNLADGHGRLGWGEQCWLRHASVIL